MNRGGTGFSGFLFIYREFREFETDMSVWFWERKVSSGIICDCYIADYFQQNITCEQCCFIL